MKHTACAIVIPAAGASSRMQGRDKLLELIKGEPLLARQTRRALATGAPVYVSTRSDRPARPLALDSLTSRDLTLVPVPNPEAGLSASIGAAVEILPPDVHAVMVLLPDLPDLETSDLLTVMQAHTAMPDKALRGTTADGTPGHPVVIPREHFRALTLLTGDEGAAPLMRTLQPATIALPGDRAVTDLDTPEAWAAWRAEHGL